MLDQIERNKNLSVSVCQKNPCTADGALQRELLDCTCTCQFAREPGSSSTLTNNSLLPVSPSTQRNNLQTIQLFCQSMFGQKFTQNYTQYNFQSPAPRLCSCCFVAVSPSHCNNTGPFAPHAKMKKKLFL